jgi:hypothetical protein
MTRVTVLLLVFCLGVTLAEDKPKKPAGDNKPGAGDAKAPAINPWHRPEGSIVNKSARFYVWYEEGTWSLRACSIRNRTFHGTAKITGEGKFKAVLPVGFQESRQKDAWGLAENRKEVKFSFRTSNKSDGLDIKVEGEGEIEFDLHIDDTQQAKVVHIGASEQHPRKNPFQLPLSPPKPAKAKAAPPK